MNSLKSILGKKTDQQLLYYVRHPDKHTEEAVLLAREELINRNVELTEDRIIINRTVIPVLDEKTKDKLFYRSLVFSFLYVGLGTISILSLNPNSVFYGMFGTTVLFITFPVNFISLAVAFTGEKTSVILVVQIIVFLLFWFALHSTLKVLARKRLSRE